MSLTFLIPCLNEAATISLVVRECKEALEQSGISGDVTVVDNGSVDGSDQLALQVGARVLHCPLRGYGAALSYGIKHIQSEYIVMLDADTTYSPNDGILLYNKAKLGFDLVIGNRFRGRIYAGAMPFLHRYLGNPVLSFLGRIFFGIQVNDFHCGIRCFKTARICSLGLISPGMEFASEMIIRAALLGLTIVECPVVLRPNPPGRRPHLRTWRDGWRHLLFMLSFSPKWAIFPIAAVQALFSALLLLCYIFEIAPFSGSFSLFSSFLLSLLAQATAGFFGIARGILKQNIRLGLASKKPERIAVGSSNSLFTFNERLFVVTFYLLIGGIFLAILSLCLSQTPETIGVFERGSKTYLLTSYVSALLIGSSILNYSILTARKTIIYYVALIASRYE